MAAPPLRRASSRCRPTSRCCTCAGTRPTPTPAGPAGGCRPRRSGRRRPATTRRPAGRAATRGATRTPTPEHANLGQRHLAAGPGGQLPAGRLPARRTAVDRRRLGVDVERLPALPGLRRLPVPRVLRGVLRRRDVQGAARRLASPWTRWPAGAPSATGTYPIRRQIFAGFRTARGRPVTCLMCRHLAYLRAAGAAGRAARRAAARAVPAVLGTAAAAARDGQRRRVRRRLVRRRRPGARALPRAPGRSGPTSRSPSWPGVVRTGRVLAAVRDATGRAADGEAAAAPFAAARWLFSHNGAVSGWPERSAPLAASLPADELLSLEARSDSALVWALVAAPAAGRATTLGQALADTVVDVAAAAPGSRLNLLLTDGERSPRPPGATRSGTSPARTRGARCWSPRSRTTTIRAGARSPTAPCCVAHPHRRPAHPPQEPDPSVSPFQLTRTSARGRHGGRAARRRRARA